MDKDNTFQFPIIPGRGLVNSSAIKLRHDFLTENQIKHHHISSYFLNHDSIQNNIESFIGTVEIPVGIVGPLLFNQKGKDSELVYTAAGTLEGALVASMNRGAKAISQSNGFTAKVLHQKMIRAPLFILQTEKEAFFFKEWVKNKYFAIQKVAESYSNHAKLTELSAHTVNNNVHVRFVYTTGDASGQNMSTSCTWHAMLWMIEQFRLETSIEIPHYIIEGNGSSDKKASQFMISHGRGVCVVASCFIEEHVLQKILRTSSTDICRYFEPSVAFAKADGMLGFNINVANAIAAIFAATGQDLASIHESSIGILTIKKENNGLFLQLELPSLVIGTVGGGTGLEKQNECLEIMQCAGSGKIERFAQLIAGFALALEISTYSAIVSGEFAKAHEKLGRNKPNNWFLKSEIDLKFIRQNMQEMLNGSAILSVELLHDFSIGNGILTSITQRINKKAIGFIPLKIELESGLSKNILIKSKALDIEVIKGLHVMAASVDPKLSDLLFHYREKLEYWYSHQKELSVYRFLSDQGVTTIPQFYGSHINMNREMYLLFYELLDKADMDLIDSENSPSLWTCDNIENAIASIHKIHEVFSEINLQKTFPEVNFFKPWDAKPLYQKMIEIIQQESEESDYSMLLIYLEELEELHANLNLSFTLVHNDYSPRNVAIRKDKRICIYDWELAVINIPHRDIVEFLCFSLSEDFKEAEFMHYVDYHFQLMNKKHPALDWKVTMNGYIYALKEFLVTRVALYKVSEVLMKLKFSDRIMCNGLRMLTILQKSQ